MKVRIFLCVFVGKKFQKSTHSCDIRQSLDYQKRKHPFLYHLPDCVNSIFKQHGQKVKVDIQVFNSEAPYGRHHRVVMKAMLCTI